MKLGKNEELVYEAQKHWCVLIIPTLATVVTLGILVPWLVYAYFRYSRDKILITNRSFSIRTGLISITIESTPLDKINNFQYNQSVMGRILGYGTIFIQSAATAGLSGYPYIKNPDEVKNALEEASEGYDIAKRKKATL